MKNTLLILPFSFLLILFPLALGAEEKDKDCAECGMSHQQNEEDQESSDFQGNRYKVTMKDDKKFITEESYYQLNYLNEFISCKGMKKQYEKMAADFNTKFGEKNGVKITVKSLENIPYKPGSSWFRRNITRYIVDDTPGGRHCQVKMAVERDCSKVTETLPNAIYLDARRDSYGDLSLKAISTFHTMNVASKYDYIGRTQMKAGTPFLSVKLRSCSDFENYWKLLENQAL
jgi:hypothetical protein